MQQKLIRSFGYSAGALLLALASAMFISNKINAGLLHPRDPVFQISMLLLFWILGGIQLVIALVCLFGKDFWLKLPLVLWLALSMAVYWWGLLLEAPAGLRGDLGSFANTFGILPVTADAALKAVFSYLLIGSSISLLWLLAEKFIARAKKSKIDYLKIACSQCAGKIEFPANGVGQEITCPHCATKVTLQQSKAELVQ